MYSPRQVFKQEPAAVKTAIMTILAALVLSGVISADEKTLVAWGLAIEFLLNLFYVRPATVTRDALNELSRGQDQ